MNTEVEELACENDLEGARAMRSSSSWTRFQLCDFAPSAKGVLKLMQKQDVQEQVTQESLSNLPWARLYSQQVIEVRVDGGTVCREFHSWGEIEIELPSIT